MQFDTQYILRLAHDKSPQSKSELVDIVVNLFDERGDSLTEGERALVFSIIHDLVREVELTVRHKLSEMLADEPTAPLNLVKNMASDELEVAYPILTRSTVLKDADLIELIHLKAEEHQLAIALRNGIGEDVTDALIETDNPRVINRMLDNQTARVSVAGMNTLVEKSQTDATLQKPLLRRSDLSEDMAKRMFLWVSAALRAYIVGQYKLDHIAIDRLLEQAAQEGFRSAMEEKAAEKSALAQQLRAHGMINQDALFKALSEGDTVVFFCILSELTGVDETVTRRIVFDKDPTYLAVLCKALAFSELNFANLYRKIFRFSKGQSVTISKHELNKVLAIYREMDELEAKHTLELWGRTEDYQSAVVAIMGTSNF